MANMSKESEWEGRGDRTENIMYLFANVILIMKTKHDKLNRFSCAVMGCMLMFVRSFAGLRVCDATQHRN